MEQTTTTRLLNILKSTERIEEFVASEEQHQLDLSLSEYLTQLLEQYGCKRADIIRKSLIDANYAYQLFNGTKDTPSRDKLLLLALAFPLTVKETQMLLYLGHAEKLYVKIKRDSIILYAIEKKLDIGELTELLEELNEEPLV